jgi:hypothetical protein
MKVVSRKMNSRNAYQQHKRREIVKLVYGSNTSRIMTCLYLIIMHGDARSNGGRLVCGCNRNRCSSRIACRLAQVRQKLEEGSKVTRVLLSYIIILSRLDVRRKRYVVRSQSGELTLFSE